MITKKTRGGVLAHNARTSIALMISGYPTTENDLLIDRQTGRWVQVLEVMNWGMLQVRALAGGPSYPLKVANSGYPDELDIYGAAAKLTGMQRTFRLLVDGDAWSLHGFFVGPFFETVHADAIRRLADDARRSGFDLLEIETCYQGKALDLSKPLGSGLIARIAL